MSLLGIAVNDEINSAMKKLLLAIALAVAATVSASAQVRAEIQLGPVRVSLGDSWPHQRHQHRYYRPVSPMVIPSCQPVVGYVPYPPPMTVPAPVVVYTVTSRVVYTTPVYYYPRTACRY